MSVAGQSAELAVRCVRHPLAPTVAIRLWVEGGQVAERRPGQALVSSRMMSEGTKSRPWDRIAADAEALGMDVQTVAGSELSGLSIDALATDWRRALDWLEEMMLESAFPEERLRWIVRQADAEHRSLGEQPDVVAGRAFLRGLYGRHPCGRPPHGSSEALAALNRDDVLAFHRSALGRRWIVSMAGEIDPDEAERRLVRAFAGRRSSPEEDSGAGQPVPEPAARYEEVTVPNSEQAHLYIGQLTVPFAHPDAVALELAAVVLGAGPGLVGRIPERVREVDGLAYVTRVATMAGAGLARGRLLVYLATAPENLERARRAVAEEFELFLSDGIERHELDRARRYLLGSAPFLRETAGQIAVLGARACLYGVPVDRESWLVERLEALDRSQVAAAVARHLDPERLLTTVGMP